MHEDGYDIAGKSRSREIPVVRGTPLNSHIEENEKTFANRSFFMRTSFCAFYECSIRYFPLLKSQSSKMDSQMLLC